MKRICFQTVKFAALVTLFTILLTANIFCQEQATFHRQAAKAYRDAAAKCGAGNPRSACYLAYANYEDCQADSLSSGSNRKCTPPSCSMDGACSGSGSSSSIGTTPPSVSTAGNAAADMLNLVFDAIGNSRAKAQRSEEEMKQYMDEEAAKRKKLSDEIEAELAQMGKSNAETVKAIEDELARQKACDQAKQQKEVFNLVGFWSGTSQYNDLPGGGPTFFRISQQRADRTFTGISSEGECVGGISNDKVFNMRCGPFDFSSVWQGKLSEDGLHITGSWATTTITGSENVRSRGKFSVDYQCK